MRERLWIRWNQRCLFPLSVFCGFLPFYLRPLSANSEPLPLQFKVSHPYNRRFNLRTEVTGFLYSAWGTLADGSNHPPLLVYIHGGGCDRFNYENSKENFEIESQSFEALPLLKALQRRGYSILVLNYMEGLHNRPFLEPLPSSSDPKYEDLRAGWEDRFLRHQGQWDQPNQKLSNSKMRALTGADLGPAVPQDRDLCSLHIEITLRDLRGLVPQLQKLGPLFFLGHSYGAYLVNLLALDEGGASADSMDPISGFISYAGVWESRDHQFDFSSLFNPTDKNPSDLRNSLLVIHSKDDAVVSYDEFLHFEAWSSRLRLSSHLTPPRIFQLSLESGGHSALNQPSVIESMAQAIDQFTRVNARP